jgi:hypothetical protein
VSPEGRLRKVWRLGFVPLLVPLLLVPFGWLLYRTVENGLKTQVEGELATILQADVTGLRLWMQEKTTSAQLIAAQDIVRVPAADLVAAAAQPGTTKRTLLRSPARRRLANSMEPLIQGTAVTGWVVLDDEGAVVASDDPALVGQTSLANADFVDRALRGQTVISHPHLSIVPLPGKNGEEAHRQPTMFVATPLRDKRSAEVFGVLMLRLPPEDFTKILTVARWGKSGETYAFDSTGRLLSRSRFEDQLKEHGLLPDRPEVQSILNMRVLDPGYNTLTDQQPRGLTPDRPLTRMAASAVTGTDGVDAQGYRDYRGVPVVGAWTWLGEPNFGVTTEVDVAEAYGSLTAVRTIFFVLFGLLAAAALALVLFSRSLYFLRIRERRGEGETDRLGQYSLEKKIGEGGLGEVWKASHVLLRRPTAVKRLHRDGTSEEEMRRFEREVTLASRLTSPHTIRIYDYGISPEGGFYYAMEYLEGADLERIVNRTGPLPEGRALAFMVQACASLQEAHAKGIIHRDIKPANLIVSAHGTELDFVVVTDFGLAKDLWVHEADDVTNPRFAVGTPRYLAPEALRKQGRVDELGDIYALGATAYFMLCGSQAVAGDSVLEIVQSVLLQTPVPPSERLERPISADVEAIIMQCLQKDPVDRVQGAGDLSRALQACASYGSWTEADAQAWWAEYGEQVKAPAQVAPVSQLSPELLRMANQWNTGQFG